MHVSVVLLGADSFFAEVNVFAPTASLQVLFIADSATNRAGFKEVGHHMAGIGPPVVIHFMLFPDLGEIIVREHSHLRNPLAHDIGCKGRAKEWADLINPILRK